MVNDYPEPREGQDPLYDGEIGRCRVCGGEVYDNEILGIEDDGRYICCDCAKDEFDRLTKYEQLLRMGLDVRLPSGTILQHS